MNNTAFSGVYAAACTPMHSDLSCNYDELARHCNDLMNRGCKGVVIFGTTGEGSSFSVQERIKAIAELIELGINPQKIIVGVSCPAIEDAVILIEASLKHNCSAVLVLPPFFYKNVDDEGVIAYYREVIHRINNPLLKILLYHIPQYSGVPITLKVIKALHEEFPNTVIGIKESEGNLTFTKEIITQFPELVVLVGKESHISEAVQIGAMGGISGLVNAFPELVCSLFEYGTDSKKPNNNEEFKDIALIFKNYPFVPAMKYLMEKEKGTNWQTLKPPLTNLNKKQREKLVKDLENI